MDSARDNTTGDIVDAMELRDMETLSRGGYRRPGFDAQAKKGPVGRPDSLDGAMRRANSRLPWRLPRQREEQARP